MVSQIDPATRGCPPRADARSESFPRLRTSDRMRSAEFDRAAVLPSRLQRRHIQTATTAAFGCVSAAGASRDFRPAANGAEEASVYAYLIVLVCAMFAPEQVGALQAYFMQHAGKHRETFMAACQNHVLWREDFRRLRANICECGVESWNPAWVAKVLQTVADLEASLHADEAPSPK